MLLAREAPHHRGPGMLLAREAPQHRGSGMLLAPWGTGTTAEEKPGAPAPSGQRKEQRENQANPLCCSIDVCDALAPTPSH